MKSGLEGRNNIRNLRAGGTQARVSMKSGLEGRNNSLQEATEFRKEIMSQ